MTVTCNNSYMHKHTLTWKKVGRDNSAGIATGYGLDGSRSLKNIESDNNNIL